MKTMSQLRSSVRSHVSATPTIRRLSSVRQHNHLSSRPQPPVSLFRSVSNLKHPSQARRVALKVSNEDKQDTQAKEPKDVSEEDKTSTTGTKSSNPKEDGEEKTAEDPDEDFTGLEKLSALFERDFTDGEATVNFLKTMKDPPNLPMEVAINQVLELVVTVALTGTIAVALGWLAQVDVFGGIHLDALDAQLGLLAILPVIVVDSLLMGPDHAEAVKEVEKEGGTVSPLRKMARDYQREKSLENPAGDLPAVAEFGVISLAHLADEMLKRGFLLGLLAKGLSLATVPSTWSINSLGQGASYQVDGGSLVAWGALALCMAGVFAQNWKVLSGPVDVRDVPGLKIAKVEKDEVTGKMKVRDMEKSDIEEEIRNDPENAKKIMEKVSSAKETINLYQKIAAGRDVLDWLCLGGAYVVTGNLLTPVVGGIVADSIYSAFQRVNMQRLRDSKADMLIRAYERMQEKMAKRKAEEEELAKANPSKDAVDDSAGSTQSSVKPPERELSPTEAALERITGTGPGKVGNDVEGKDTST